MALKRTKIKRLSTREQWWPLFSVAVPQINQSLAHTHTQIHTAIYMYICDGAAFFYHCDVSVFCTNICLNGHQHTLATNTIWFILVFGIHFMKSVTFQQMNAIASAFFERKKKQKPTEEYIVSIYVIFMRFCVHLFWCKLFCEKFSNHFWWLQSSFILFYFFLSLSHSTKYILIVQHESFE